jgi:hypothetical protein
VGRLPPRRAGVRRPGVGARVRRPIPARLRGRTLARGFGFRGRRPFFWHGRRRWLFGVGVGAVGPWYFWSPTYGVYLPYDLIDDYPPADDDPDTEADDPDDVPPPPDQTPEPPPDQSGQDD